MRKILTSLVMIALASSTAIGATRAYFTDTETSIDNIITAGKIDLTVDGENNTVSKKFSITGVTPGFDSGYKVWCLKNEGDISGQPYVEFSSIANADNGSNTPESLAEDEVTGTSEDGELGQYMKFTIGVGPCGWTVPSLLTSEWQTGPKHPWGTPGVNALSGNKYFQGPTGYKFPVLKPNESYGFFMKVAVDSDVKRWDGTKWLDVNDNVIQSDGVEFDILFHLDQVI